MTYTFNNRVPTSLTQLTRPFEWQEKIKMNLGLFAQDQWTVNNKLTLNYGLRIEREVIPSYKPENPGIEFGWGDKLAPRLGFAYDIKGDGRLKAFGSFGIYYDNMKLEMPRGAWGGDHWIDYVYTLDTPNWESITCSDINGGRGFVLEQGGATVQTVAFAYDEDGRVTDVFIVRNPDKLARLDSGTLH